MLTKTFSNNVAEISSLDDEDKKNYINNMQTARDTYNQLEYAKKKGREEGLPIQTICACTGLSTEGSGKIAGPI